MRDYQATLNELMDAVYLALPSEGQNYLRREMVGESEDTVTIAMDILATYQFLFWMGIYTIT